MPMDTKRKMVLRGEAQTLKANFDIGKEGVTEAVVSELKVRFKKQRLIKVRLQLSSLEEMSKKELAEKVAVATNSEIIDIRGRTAVFYKR